MTIGESWQNRRGDTITVTANGLMVTPRGARAQNCRPERDPLQEQRVVTSLRLTPRSLDGKSGGQVVKNIRVGPKPMATFAAPTPYFRLSAARRGELEAQADALKVQIAYPGLDPVLKVRLKQDLSKLLHELAMDASATPDYRTTEELRLGR